MEHIVLGLSKSVVEATVSKVRSAIEEEKKLKLTVQSDLVFITGEFEIMQSFLNTADAERIKNNNAVKTWVKQLRDLAHDAEDCIELVVHLDPKPTLLRRLLMPPCLGGGAPLPIDDAMAEIKQLKERVEHVSQRNMRYNLINDLGSSAQQQLERRALDLDLDVPVPVPVPFEARYKKDGEITQVQDLAELIPTKEENRRELGVISVWGTSSNLGMTSIIRKAYDDPEICKTFAYRGWAKFTVPLNARAILRSLLAQFCRNNLRKQGSSSIDVDSLLRMEAMVQGDELIKEFVKHVNNHRYLIVLEDLSSMVEWDTIRMYLPDKGNGSQIIVSTQHLDIASMCTSQPYKVSELRKFSPHHSVCVFSKEDYSQRERRSNMFGDAGSSMDQSQLIGREPEKKQLLSKIGEDYSVISVWGIVGVGKQTLVRSACKEYVRNIRHTGLFLQLHRIRSSHMHAWVNVSHPFNILEFCRSLLLDLNPVAKEENAESHLARIGDPMEACRRLLSAADISCLIVINNLQCAEEWDLIKDALKFGKGCCIVVITTEANVAKHCSRHDELVFNVKGLDEGSAFELFKQVHNRQPDYVLELGDDREMQAKLILNKCGGLPKVIVAVAEHLAKKFSWEAMHQSFMQELETNPALDSVQNLFGWLDSYFHTCPDFLKPCIFYLSIFPRGQGIRRRRLVRRWIAEGYSRDTDGVLAEVNAEDYLSRLVDLSMIQQAPSHGAAAAGRRMAMCYTNDFFREYIISRRMDENHVFALQGSCSQTTKRMGRHLVIEESWDRDKIVFGRIEFSRLRSLTVFGSWKPFFTSDNMRVLRVLDLEGTSGLADDDIRKIVMQLRRLKFLSLRGCKDISRLPACMGRLRQLETLDVRQTAVTSLPATVTKLQKLQYVRAGTSPSQAVGSPEPSRRSTWTTRVLTCLSIAAGYRVGVNMPRGLGNLANLHTLGVIHATGAGLEEIKNLTQLRKLGVSGINRKNHNHLCSVISGHAHLESLSVWLDKDMLQGTGHHLDDDIAEPPKKLQMMKLHGHVDRLPLWIKKLPSLRVLHLEMSVFVTTQVDGEVLQGLHGLVLMHLYVKQLKDGELCITFVADSIKVLEISCSSTLRVTFEERAMKNLAVLKFRCDGLSALELSGMENLNSIKEVLLEGTYGGDDIKRSLHGILDSHRNKPVLCECN